MRTLTLKREKSFVGCLAKMKVFIEDPQGDTFIGKSPCRLLGILKNGEEGKYEITNNSAKVFVIADLISKDWCNDFYQLEAGEEDIVLTGKNKFNPATGNSFIFDNNTNEESLSNRKKSRRNGWIILVCAAVIGFVLGLSLTNLSSMQIVKNKTFTKEDFSITLTTAFEENTTEENGYFVRYYSENSAVFVMRDTALDYPQIKTFDHQEYANWILELNAPDQQLKKEDNYYYFEYVWLNDENGIVFHYSTYLFESENAFWEVTFASQQENYNSTLKAQENNWANSVTFE